MKKNKLIKIFHKNFTFDLNYSDIKNNIDVEQYLNSNKHRYINKVQLKFLCISIFILSVVSLGLIIISSPRIEYKSNNNYITFKHDKEFVDNFEYIFVAKVIEKQGTKQYDGTGMDIPYTFYSFKQLYTLKGEKLSADSLLCFYGGNKNLNKIEVLEFNDEIIEVNQYYLFFVNISNKNESNRISNENLIISNNNQKILLNNYDESKNLFEQSNNIQNIIYRYYNIINRNLNNEILDIPEFVSKKDLYNSVSNVAIIKVNHFFPFSTKGIGIYSEIPSAYYDIEIIENLKGNTESYNKKLYCYGTNLWGNEYINNSVKLLHEEEVYLLLANRCESNIENTRMDVGDLVVKGDYQLILLDQYLIEKDYMKQNEEIVNIINEYIK